MIQMLQNALYHFLKIFIKVTIYNSKVCLKGTCLQISSLMLLNLGNFYAEFSPEETVLGVSLASLRPSSSWQKGIYGAVGKDEQRCKIYLWQKKSTYSRNKLGHDIRNE